MKMVSSAKLRKAQKNIESFYPYNQSLMRLLNNFLSAETDVQSIFAEVRDVKRVAVVAFSSNGSLNGAFNSNVAKRLTAVIDQYSHLGKENILIYPVGKKVHKATRKMDFVPQGDYEQMADKPTYQAAQEVANEVMELYRTGQVDKVVLIYHHFKSRSTQELVAETLLPLELNALQKETDEKLKYELNYIVEPDVQAIINELIPKVIRLRLYTALLDSAASEHAARVIAMQIATDNADDILHELSIQYNKSRQQAITNELLDIIGGSFGQQ